MAVCSSCKKTDNPPLKAALTLSINADSTSFNLVTPTKNQTPPGISFTSGAMAVSTIKFDAAKNGKAIESITPGSGSVDLFATAPRVYTITLDTGSYNSVEIRVKLLKSAVAAPLILKGNYTPAAGAAVPLEVDFNENTEIKVKVKDRLLVDGYNDFTSYLKLFLNHLFTGIAATDVDKATRTNGVILINSAVNKTIYAKIKTNILNAAGGDGVQIEVED